MGKRSFKNAVDREYQAAFGKKVRAERGKHEWTQRDLAAASNVSEGQISAIENGLESPRLHTLKAIALALGRMPSDMLEFPFDLKPNKSFPRSPHRKTGVTAAIKTLFDEGFFRIPRSVNDVLEQCKKKQNRELKSAETSGVLLQLVKAKQLKKIKAGTRNQYVNR